ncbi:MAG: class I SAM-dependent methyltransferase [Desulfobulbus sp.]|nr:class I SAM-dependent methyltransferase [Desulfobulbus sp.]
MATALFDTWTDRYDLWFATPIGQLVRWYEAEILLNFLEPQPGERILDVGCGTGIFTVDVLKSGAWVTGIDLSASMLARAVTRGGESFAGLCADMCALPFADNSFDRVFSMTAIEFVADAAKAIGELNRVVKPGGRVVLTSLNSLSPWAEQRRSKAATEGHALFEQASFRSPEEIRSLIPVACQSKTAIHFLKQDPVDKVPQIEQKGMEQNLETGAFLAVRWDKV